MAKTGIGALLFAIIFGVIFGFSGYWFIGIIAGLDFVEAGIFAGPLAAMGLILIIIFGGVAAISGILTIVCLISGFTNMKRFIAYKKAQNQ